MEIGSCTKEQELLLSETVPETTSDCISTHPKEHLVLGCLKAAQAAMQATFNRDGINQSTVAVVRCARLSKKVGSSERTI